MSGDKKRHEFEPTNVSVLVAEARQCIKKFFPSLEKDFAESTHKEVLESIIGVYEDQGPIDVISFRFGMYALGIELARQYKNATTMIPGERFVV